MELKKAENTITETSRMEAFSDGVFAIAITLLVLDIHVPIVKDNQSLLQSLLADWATYVAFLIGFFTILICWINHHYMFEFISRSNGKLLLLNGFKLLVVCFTPFATAILSRYIGTNHQQTAVNIYTFNFFFMGSAMCCLWYYASRNGLIKTIAPETRKAINYTPLLFGTCIFRCCLYSFIYFHNHMLNSFYYHVFNFYDSRKN